MINDINSLKIRPVGFEPNSIGQLSNKINIKKPIRECLDSECPKRAFFYPLLTRLSIIIFTVCLLASPVHADYKFADSWSWTDTAYQGVFWTVTAVDWAQTRWMVKQDWQWDGKNHHEMNPILGNHPSLDKVNTLIPLAMVAHTLVALALPPRIKWNGEDVKVFKVKVNPRRIWQCVFIGVEVGAVGHNIGGGVKLDF